jgi:CRISPR-associated protein Cas4
MVSLTKQSKPKLISISDIVSYLYCPRKLYLTKIKRIQQPPTREMLIGRLKHQILENFSNKEKELVITIDQDYDKLDLVLMYEQFLSSIAEPILKENKLSLEGFKVSTEEVMKKVYSSFTEDIKLRITALKEKLKQGFFNENLWNNLDSIFISEISLESEHYGLKGRVDRIELSKKTNLIIPYELKSRDQKIFPSDEIQLTAYAMLLEDNYKTTINKGIIAVGGLKQELAITQELKNKVLSLAEEIRNLSENQAPCMQSNFNKCKSCSLNEICPEF